MISQANTLAEYPDGSESGYWRWRHISRVGATGFLRLYQTVSLTGNDLSGQADKLLFEKDRDGILDRLCG